MIHILWCTIRPTYFTSVHPRWIINAENKSNIKTYVCVNTQDQYDYIRKYDEKIDIEISDDPNRIGVCYPSYLLSSKLKGDKNDIVVFASDDFVPPIKWDTYLINKLDGKDGCLMVRDGYQLPDSSNMQYPAITIPIMTFSCLERLNKIIYNPSYNHMYSDCELYLNLKELGLLIDDRINDITVFEHHHYAAGKRQPDFNDQNYNKKWKDDESKWNIRKNMKVEERIKYDK